MNEGNVYNLKLRLISYRIIDARVNNQSDVLKVVVLIVEDVDMLVEKDGGQLPRIYNFHAIYLAFEYTLNFLYKKHGYRTNVAHRDLKIFLRE